MKRDFFIKYKTAFLGLPLVKKAPFYFLFWPTIMGTTLYFIKVQLISDSNKLYDIYDTNLISKHLKDNKI